MARFRHHHTTTDLEGRFTVNLLSNIASDTYGSVYTCKNITGETFAVKKLLHRLPNKENCSEEEKQNVKRFRSELSTLILGPGHRNIAKFIDLFEGVQKHDWLVSEYCEHGDLNKYLAKEASHRECKLNIMLQCSRAVEYLHNLKLVHRDIKPENVLLKSENGELWVKLADLGLAKIYENHPDPDIKDEISEKCMVGSCYFMAPEIFEEKAEWIYKEPVDIFSLGLLFLVLHRHDRQKLDRNMQILPVSVQHLDKELPAAGSPFYAVELITSLQDQTERPQLFANGDTGSLQELIVKMTDYYPERRPKAAEIVKELQNIIGLRGGRHTGGARPKTYLNTESHIITPRVGSTKLNKKNEAMDLLPEANDEKNKIRMVTPRNTRGQYDRTQHCKNILLIGETGSGKTTLVDGIYNFIRQVKWDEPNRYCITEFDKEFKDQHEEERGPSESETEWITVYSLPTGQKFILNVVDTPGLADTKGVKYDEHFKERLQEFFKNSKGHGILTVDAVCCVWSASENRLTAARLKIIESVGSLFARDIQKSMVCLACFADEFEPQVYDLLDIPMQNKFKFNNGILFKGRGLKNTWEWTMESYGHFFNYLIKVEPVSTKLTVKMLQQKTLLEQEISVFKEKVQNQCELVQEHQHIVYQLNQMTEEESTLKIKTFKHYKYKVPNDRKKEALQCKKCEKTTCHYPCKQWDVAVFKYLFCERFGLSGKCRICGHSVLDHVKNKESHYEIKRVPVERSVAELIEQYNRVVTEKNKKDLIKTLESLQEKNRQILIMAMYKIHDLSQDLHKIAMYIETKENAVDIIADFIKEEQREKKESFEERVMIYEECKKEISINTNQQAIANQSYPNQHSFVAQYIAPCLPVGKYLKH